jgi:hypothetical protein
MPVGLGTLKIPLGRTGYFYTLTGGPFRECPRNYFGVKMAAEIPARAGYDHVDIPTRDFCVPDMTTLYKGLETAVAALVAGTPLYVGCMAGKGRTGLFMAVLAKAFGVKNPVEYVRANYYAHAVETADQYAFVSAFPVLPNVRKMIRRERLKYWYHCAFMGYASLTNIPVKPDYPAQPGAFDGFQRAYDALREACEPHKVSDPNTPAAKAYASEYWDGRNLLTPLR